MAKRCEKCKKLYFDIYHTCPFCDRYQNESSKFNYDPKLKLIVYLKGTDNNRVTIGNSSKLENGNVIKFSSDRLNQFKEKKKI